MVQAYFNGPKVLGVPLSSGQLHDPCQGPGIGDMSALQVRIFESVELPARALKQPAELACFQFRVLSVHCNALPGTNSHCWHH